MAEHVSAQILADESLLLVVTGSLIANNCRAHLARALHYRGPNKASKVLVDLRPANFEVSQREVESLARSFNLEDLYKNRRIAVVANRGVATGVLRHFLKLTDTRPDQLSLFDDEFSAQTWLGL
jgi:hypothetical protein